MARGSDLASDCSRCAGLCCMAFAFEPSEDFAIHKPAGAACPHLRGDFGCAIHAEREARGFPGCIAFDCLGAGQRVVQDVLPGVDWQAGEAQRRRVIETFRALRELHRLLQLLHTAGHLPLPRAEEAERQRLIEALDPDAGWSEAGLARFEAGPLPKRVAAFLHGLRDLAPVRRPA